MDWLIKRGAEPSTWRGIVALAGLLGINLSPEDAAIIANIAITVIAVINIIRKEHG